MAVRTTPTRLDSSLAWGAAAALAIVDGLFAWKYGARLPGPTWGAVGLHVGVLVGAGALGARADTPRRYAVLLGVVAVGGLAGLAAVDTVPLRVDRWFMIDTFLRNVGEGVYPYTPRPYPGSSGPVNVPGPLPVYYLLFAPFWALGDVGLATLAAFVGFGALLWRWVPRPGAGASVALVAASVPFLWEVAVRSTVFVNAAVAVAFVGALYRWRPRGWGAVVGAGCLAGLLLSTRSVVAIPLAAAFAHVFLRDGRLGAFVAAGTVAAVVFALTLVPLYLWSPEGFATYNPLMVQSNFSSVPMAAAAVAGALFVGWRSPSLIALLAGIGAVLVLMVGAVMAHNVIVDGWPETLLGSRFDISYFLLAVPFLVPSSATLRVRAERAQPVAAA